MRSKIHPQYRKVRYVDTATNEGWISYSTMTSSETVEENGEEIPVIRLEISSFSHPFWTGQARELDAEGRIDRFRRRYLQKQADKK